MYKVGGIVFHLKFKFMKLHLFCMFVSIIILSCSKEGHQAQGETIMSLEESNQTILFEYYEDMELTDSFCIDTSEEFRYLILARIPTDSSNIFIDRIHRFSSDSGYWAFGDSIELPLRNQDLIANRLSFLADSLNMDSVISANADTIPSWWFDLEEDTRELYSFNSGRITTRTAYSVIHNHFTRTYQGCASEDPNSSWLLQMPGNPNLWFIGWCNKVSSFIPIGLYGFDIVFDKPFYRKKLATFWAWGAGTIQFCGPYQLLNDKACSWINGGI